MPGNLIETTHGSCLKSIRMKNINKVIIAQININSIRNKFEILSGLIKGNIDVLLITETNLGSSFHITQLLIEGAVIERGFRYISGKIFFLRL